MRGPWLLRAWLVALCAIGTSFAFSGTDRTFLSSAEIYVVDDVRELEKDVTDVVAEEWSGFGELRRNVRLGLNGRASQEQRSENTEEPQGKRKGEYFRPVSTTVHCVMLLTLESLVIYTCLTCSRNADELAGLVDKPSVLTDVLSVGARSIAFPPMMCMLFVACRMYVLATTEGLGEPQWWAKACMITATAGVTLQYMVVLGIPLVTDPPKGGKTFSHVSGASSDAHPMLVRHAFLSASAEVMTWVLQIACMVCIYGGVFGVVLAILIYPEGTTKVSPAVQCTVALCILYFCTQLFLFLVHTIVELHTQEKDEPERVHEELPGDGHLPSEWRTGTPPVADKPQEFVEPSEHAKMFMAGAICACQAVRKAPMLSVLFLASRMRALQLDPPHGMPPPHIQRCFYLLTAALYVEALASACVGITGRAVTIAGHRLYESGRCLHIFEYALAAMPFAALWPIYLANLEMTTASGDAVPLSTTLRCVFLLAGLYFGVEFFRWLCFVMKDVLGGEIPTLIETSLAASISVSFCPLMCILFVAARMRALQITQQKAGPQHWAQDAMLTAVFAIYFQALCCLALPVFTRGATHVDPEGNVVYDLRPMVGAYAITVSKYVALMALHGSLLTVCVAIWAITPETASVGPPPFSNKWLLEYIGFAFLTLLIAMLLGSAKVIGLAVKFAIESADEALLGVQITVTAAALSICRGYVNVSGLVVENPAGERGELTHKWNSDCLAKVDRVVLKVNICRIIRTGGKEFEINTVLLQGVQVNYDKPSLSEDSNVQTVLEHMKGSQDKHARASFGKANAGKVEEPAKEQEVEVAKKKNKKKSAAFVPDIIIGELNLADIGAAAHIGIKGQVFSLHAAIAPIEYEDLMEAMGGERGEPLKPKELHGIDQAAASAGMAADIVKFVVKTLLISVNKNVQPVLKRALSEGMSKAGAVLLNKVTKCCKRQR